MSVKVNVVTGIEITDHKAEVKARIKEMPQECRCTKKRSANRKPINTNTVLIEVML